MLYKQWTEIKHCQRCDSTLDAVRTARVVSVMRTDNHYIEVCPRCAEFLEAAGTHRRLQKGSEPDARD